ncbi:MAG: hypothetical protein KME08_19855 [Aphanothece sp. CMT-3BRIN-NPC111]|nr:hypothetical protein [Aphanothece sp. CMT-3BRIN-NPC111]
MTSTETMAFYHPQHHCRLASRREVRALPPGGQRREDVTLREKKPALTTKKLKIARVKL